jgi:hypothetical protein
MLALFLFAFLPLPLVVRGAALIAALFKGFACAV